MCVELEHANISKRTRQKYDANEKWNQRGKNLPVKVGETALTVTFVTPEADGDYAVFVEQNWVANRSVIKKEATGFTVQFEKPAPTDAKLDWMIVR